jgi:hypothetical protein
MYSTEVQAINVDKVKRQVSGVTLKNGQRLEADIVVRAPRPHGPLPGSLCCAPVAGHQ